MFGEMEIVQPSPTIVEQVYKTILEAICDGRLTPGERLTQESVAQKLSVSRQPVGQALLLLKQQKFVSEAGRRGLMVAPLDRDFMRSIYELRLGIEPLAASLAAAHATADDIARGERIDGHPLANTTTPAEAQYRRDDGKEVVAVSTAPIEPVGWRVILEQPTEDAFAPARELERQLLLFVTLALLANIGIGIAFGRSLLRPISDLLSGIRAIGEGDLDRILRRTPPEPEDDLE